MKRCPVCQCEISEASVFCPQCRASLSAAAASHGFEYRSAATFLGLPLLHISFKYGPGRRPVVAKGVIAIGQFAVGYVAVGQVAVGIFALGQIVVGGLVAGQVALAYWLVAQVGLYLHAGHGQVVRSLLKLLGH